MRVSLVAMALFWASGQAAAKDVGSVILIGKPGPTGKFVVAVDAGTSAGVNKGDTLCVFDEDDAKVTCGVVIVAKPTASSLFFDAAFQKRVQKGQRVELTRAAQSKDNPSEPTVPATKERQKTLTKDAAERAELDGDLAAPRTKRAKTKIVASYLYGAVEPIVYRGVGFSTNTSTDVVASPWVKRDEASGYSTGLGLAVHTPLAHRIALATTFYLLSPGEVQAKTVITSTSSTNEVVTLTASRLAALAVDAHYGFLQGGSYQAWLIGGLSFLQSLVDVKAKLQGTNKDSTTLVDYNSYRYLLGFDLGAAFAFDLHSGLLLQADVMATVPMATIVDGYSGSTDFSAVDLEGADYTLDALHDAVDHRSAGVGARLSLGLGWSF